MRGEGRLTEMKAALTRRGRARSDGAELVWRLRALSPRSRLSIAALLGGDALAQNAAIALASSKPSLHATPRAGSRPPPNVSAPSSRARPPTRARLAAKTTSSCSSARIRRPSAARSTDRSRACRPISPICKRAKAAERAISSRATTRNASTRRQDPPISSRLCSAASQGSCLYPSRRRTPDSNRSIATREGRQTKPDRGRKGMSRRIPAPTRFACAPATAASFPCPIRAPGAAPTAWRRFAGPCAPTPTWRSLISLWRNDRRGRVVFERRALCEFT